MVLAGNTEKYTKHPPQDQFEAVSIILVRVSDEYRDSTAFVYTYTAATFTLTSPIPPPPPLPPSRHWMNKKEEDEAINQENNRSFGGSVIKSLINPLTMILLWTCMIWRSGKIKLPSN